MICPECGKENPDDRSFCLNCGAILDGMTRLPGKDPDSTRITPPKGAVKPDDAGGTRIEPPSGGDRAPVAEETDPAKPVSNEERILRELVSERYEILGKLGAGGMATVYLAREIALDRQVAIKVLPQAYLRDEDFVTRFKREAQVAANLEHPNIVRIYQISEDENLCFFVMSHIPGGSIGDKIKDQGALTVDEIVRWGVEVSSALAYAHERGIIHRDLKPDNIMLDANGRAIVTDFGIARAAMGTKLTQTGAVIGTPRYMSPEQARGTELDGRSDIYSMGVLLYQMATGSLPFQATDAASLMYMHVHEAPEAPDVRNADVPDWLRDIILKCLEKNPDDRFANAMDLAKALDEHQKPTLSKKGKKTGLWIGLAAAVIIIAGGGVIWKQMTREKPAVTVGQAPSTGTPQEQPAAPPGETVNKDDIAFQQAQMVNTKQSYETYLKLYPSGAHIEEAKNLIAEIEKQEEEKQKTEAAQQEQRLRDRQTQTDQSRQADEERRKAETARQDDLAFQQSVMVNTQQSYETYLTLYPQGSHAEEARKKIDEIKSRLSEQERSKAEEEAKKDDQAFQVAMNTNSPESYNSYIITYPAGRHSADAKARLKAFDEQKALNEKVRLGLSQFSIKLVTVPGGSFLMGSESGGDEEKPAHKVSVNGFQMGETEITQNQYKAVTGNNPAFNKEFDNNPVERVTWFDAIKFCNTLSEKLNLEPCYNPGTGACDFTKNGFRLPTEAEWEYACRSGTGTDYYTGDDQRAMATAGWFAGNSGEKSHRTGGKAANSFALFDMHGNVWEWCNDWYAKDYYAKSPAVNPTGPASGTDRVVRGGSWIENAKGCRSARRREYDPKKDYSDIGFRIVRR
ncbi:SUMF1/EgtB/PvdO family nonheme iron enzyme [bacterium]|nr:SUMF1/EgtB/PvdO family nonheme iron enzyme [bacterium]